MGYFSENYAQAKEKFLQSARDRNLHPTTYSCSDSVKGSQQEKLSTDVVYIGNKGAPNLLILSSGIHGVEGYAGSAIQTACLKNGLFDNLHEDSAVLIVHALNPYGMSHFMRTDENNVDNNRNFLPGFAPEDLPPSHPLMAYMDDLYLTDPKDEIDKNQRKAMRDWLEANDLPTVMMALAQGQYEKKDALFFGGTAPSFTNKTWRTILDQYAKGRENVISIDIHTGLGPRGHGELVPFIEGTRDDAVDKARDIWGLVADNQDHNDKKVVQYKSSGLMHVAVEDVANDDAVSVTLEFGAQPPPLVVQALMYSTKAWKEGFQNKALNEAARQAMREAFYPDDPQWQQAVIARGLQTTCQALLAMKGAPEPNLKLESFMPPVSKPDRPAPE